jgi:hypothetical protein
MVQISPADTVFRIWSGSGKKGLGQTKKSGSDPNILDPTGSGSLTLSRTQNGLFKNLCGQKNGRILFRIAKKVSRMDQNFLKVYIIFRIFWPKNFGGGFWQHCYPDRPKDFAICCKCTQ